MKLTFVVGTRPELIKLNSLIQLAFERGSAVELIHTGQHYDFEMSEIFFKELHLPSPGVFLEVGSGTHGVQTGEAVSRVEASLMNNQPDVVIVVGDTNSTVAGLLAGIKLGIPVAHVEAGVRSFDWTMPEEINRRLVDSVATLCFAPTPRALANLRYEGRAEDAFLVGDTLVETCRPMAEVARCTSTILDDLGVKARAYGLLTLHRSENVDSPERLRVLVSALEEADYPILYPIHPRAHKMFNQFDLLDRLESSTRLMPPLGYIDFLQLLSQASLVLTDSGGVQQEASILGVPCLTLRNNTEWIETIELGQNQLVSMEKAAILAAIRQRLQVEHRPQLFNPDSPFQPGAAQRILIILEAKRDKSQLSIPRSDFIRYGLPKFQYAGSTSA